MIKKFSNQIRNLILLASIVGGISGAAQERKTLALSSATETINPETFTKAPEGVKAPVRNVSSQRENAKIKRDAYGMTWTVLIDEDFSKLTKGTEQEPDEERLCYYYGEPGMDIDPKYTQQPGWTGSNAFSAGGAILMKEVNATTGAPLNTPLGDYSGNLTISFRYRILPGYDKHSQVIVDVLKGDIDHPQVADCDFNFFSCHVYPGQEEWRTAEMTCRNLSADNDGFIQFNCYGAVIIDDIEIKAAHDFIASPVLKPVSNFTETSFTANWEPVRLASFYYVELQKKVYTSDSETADYSLDFEETTDAVPQGWTISGFNPDRITNEGNGNTKGLVMTNGDYIETPYNLAKYNWFKMYGRLITPEGFDIYDISGYVNFSLRTEDGWLPLSSAYAGWFYDPWELDFGIDLYPDFDNNFYGLRIEVTGLAEGTYLVFDDFEFQTGRPSKLETVISIDDYERVPDGDYSYTFSGLEPESEYYYGIYAFYQGMYSLPSKAHAFGVAAPVLLPASDITSDSYTANWENAAKATGYNVTNYGVFEAKEDIKEHIILEEDFSKITTDLTWGVSITDPENLGNYTECSLDAYTTLPGWTGKGNIAYVEALGVEDSMNALFFIQTPPMSLDNDESFVLGLMGETMYDDVLIVWVNERDYRLPLSAGEFGGEFDIPEHGDNLTLTFYTANGSPFALQYVSVAQNIKKGQKTYTYLGEQTVDADTLSATFSNLASGYDIYAYTVKSIFEYEGKTAYSSCDEKMLVDIVNGTSSNGVDTIDAAEGEAIQWYSIDGRELVRPEKGLCIARYPDGSVRKILVKE